MGLLSLFLHTPLSLLHHIVFNTFNYFHKQLLLRSKTLASILKNTKSNLIFNLKCTLSEENIKLHVLDLIVLVRENINIIKNMRKI